MRSISLRFILLAVVVATFAVAPLQGMKFPSPKELRQRVCDNDPIICEIDEGRSQVNFHTFPRQMRGLYHGLFDWALDTISDEMSFSSLQKQAMHSYKNENPEILKQKIFQLIEQRQQIQTGGHPKENGTHPFWGFVPQLMGHAYLNQTLSFASPCFQKVSVSPTLVSDGFQDLVEVSVDLNDRTGFLCSDRLYFTIGATTHELTADSIGKYQFPIDVTLKMLNPALKWDLEMKGVRVFRFHSAHIDRVLDVVATLLLFWPMVTNHVDGWAAELNVDYLSNYTLLKPYPVKRNVWNRVNLTPGVDVKSGDLFAKLDLNGLGTTEMVGQGTTSGHVAIALLNETSGRYQVCEAIIKGITCTDYDDWTMEMQNQNLAITLVPLAKPFSENFNLTAAWNFVNSVLGNEYGYHNFIFGWIDTAEKNYPCFPDTFERCLTYEHFEIVMFFLDEFLPSLANKFAGEALNHRAGTKGKNIPDAFYYAYQNKGLINGDLMAVVEEDDWKYTITNNRINGTIQGPSMVCSVLGCNILRQAGVFDSINRELQCAEVDVWDMFSMKVFDADRMGSGRPAACIAADPTNPLCQITGTWTFNLLSDVNTVVPFVNISNHCATQGPHPFNREGCF